MADTYLQNLVWRFPRLELSIKRLHREDPEFRSICEEMEMADSARDRWRDMPAPEAIVTMDHAPVMH